MLWIAIMLLVMFPFFMQSASAEVQYYTVKNTNFTSGGVSMTNVTRLHTWIWYRADANDYIGSGRPFEFAIGYQIQNLSDWNSVYPQYHIDYCQFWIRQTIIQRNTFGQIINSTQITTFKSTFTPENVSYFNLQKFVQLKDGESALIDWDCYFPYGTTTSNIPVTVEITSPTRECKACQYYEYSKIERDSAVAENVASNTASIFTYIKEFISLNFEVIIIFFWIFMLASLFIALGMIFIGIYWFYLFIKRLST